MDLGRVGTLIETPGVGAAKNRSISLYTHRATESPSWGRELRHSELTIENQMLQTELLRFGYREGRGITNIEEISRYDCLNDFSLRDIALELH